MKFLVDNQLPPYLAHVIRGCGAEAMHVTDLGLRDATDLEIWRYASTGGFVVISKDEDFVSLYSKSPTAGLLWVRLGNCRRVHLVNVFQQAWPRIVQRFAGGDRFVELR